MKAASTNTPGKSRLFGKDFTLVVIGQIVSLFGNSILRFALPLYVLHESGSPALFGLVSASAFIPMVIMSPIGGIIADRVNKQRIMVVLDVITALLLGGFMILMGSIEIIPLVVVLLMMLYAIQGAYSPAVQASIPALAPEDKLMPANATVNLVQSLSSLLGPIAGGILYGSFGLAPIVIVSCICFGVAAFFELFIRIPYVKQPKNAGIIEIVKDDLKESFSFIVRKNPTIGKVILLVFFFNVFLSSMIIIGMPVIITGTLGLSSELYGLSQGGLAIGGVLGGILAGTLSKKLLVRNSYKFLIGCTLGIIPMGLVLVLSVPAMVSFMVLTVMCAAIMVCSTIFSIQMLSFVQGQTPIEIVGKVISCLMALTMCGQPIGQALYGMLFEIFSGSPATVIFGATIVSLGIALYSKNLFQKLENDSTSKDKEPALGLFVSNKEVVGIVEK